MQYLGIYAPRAYPSKMPLSLASRAAHAAIAPLLLITLLDDSNASGAYAFHRRGVLTSGASGAP